MKKITKLLSVFVIAGAIGTGIAGAAGCKHKHTYSEEWTSAGAEGHYHMATCKHTDEHDELVDHVYDNDKDTTCNDCGYVRTVTPENPNPENPNPENPNPENPTPGPSEEVKATGVTIGSGIGAVKVGVAVTLTAQVTPSNSTDTVKWSITEGGDIASIDETTGAITATAGGTITVKATAGDKTATIILRVVKDEEGLTYITSAAELNEFRTKAEHSGIYKLACNIDMEGVKLEATKAVLKEGLTFDGDGYTISNALYNAAEKTGILFESSTGGTATNVKFLNCVANGTGNETVGLVVGLGNGGNFSKIEFNSCNATCNNYGGLVVGRNSSQATINISEITAKNGCSVTTTQYGGLLVGDVLGTSTVNFKDLHLDGALKGSSGNGSFVAGRTRAGATIKIENAVISAEISTPANNAIFSGNGACKLLTIKNVLVVKSNSALIAKVAPTTADYANIATVTGVNVTGATATDGQNTVAYLTDTIGLDFENTWMAEGESGYRLKVASTNIKSPDATISDIKVNTNNVKLRFKKGEAFTAEGLVVMGAYSDGVQLVLNAETGYEVDASDVKDEAGKYSVIVKSREDGTVAATYEITVAEQTGFIVIDEFMAHTYLLGEKLDTANLVVKSTWTDGVEETLAAKDYTITAASYDMTTAGAYNVEIKFGSYEAKTIKISVSATKPVPVDGKIYINVDSEYTGINGAQVNGVETFNTVADAIDYLEACKLDDSVQKVVNIAAGRYEAKITTNLANLVLIGEGDDKSVITYSAVEGMTDPVTGKLYGMDCATLHINGEGFKAYNLTIRNDFNYIRDNKKYASPQGFALTINGDKAVLENCHLYGNQDTLFLRNGRTYFKNTLIEGNVDFIFGENTGLAFFDTCEIKSISRYETPNSNNGYVTAMKGDTAKKVNYGYVFKDCSFTDDGTLLEGSMSLGRPWGQGATVAMIDCDFSAAYSTHGFKTDVKDPAKPNEFYKGRWEEMSGNSPTTGDFKEYGSTGAGAITDAVVGGGVLTPEQAANYTAANVFKGTNGGVTWSSGDWAYADDVALLAVLAGEKVAATGIYVSSTNISVEEGKVEELLISVNPWNADDKTLAGLTVTPGDSSIATYANGKVTGVAQGTTTLTISATGMTDVVVNVTVTAAVPVTSVTYTYTYGGTNDAAWVEDTSQGTINSVVDGSYAQATGIKLVPGTYLTLDLDQAYTKITLAEVIGFTTGSDKASNYISIELLDASGNTVKTITGTTGTMKANKPITFTNASETSSTAFTKVRITSNTSGKSVAITSANLKFE